MSRLRTQVRIALPRAVTLAVLATTGVAAAVVHAALLRSEPTAGSTVPSAPAEVRLWFSEPVEPAPDPLIVLDPRGVRVDEDARVSPEDATRLEARVRDAGAGSYTVRWHVVSEDGHVISGAHLYHVERATRTDPAAEGSPSHTVGVTIARVIQDGGAALAVGALALAWLLGAPAGPEARRISTLGAAGSLVALLGAGLSAWAQSAALGGGPVAAARAAGPVWGALWATRTVAAAGLLGFFLTGRAAGSLTGARRAGAPALACALVVALAADGHARAASPVWLAVPSQALHLAATGAWLGGAVALGALLRARRTSDELLRIVPRFSTLSLVSVEVLVATGLYQSWTHVARPGLLLESLYGGTLLAKLALVGLIAVPAALNRFVVLPRLRAASRRSGSSDGSPGGDPAARLARLLGIEVAVGTAVLACGAMLATLPPPVDLRAEPIPPVAATPAAPTPGSAPAITRSAPGPDGGTVELTLDPGAVGSNALRVTTRGGDGAPRDPGALRVRAIPPEGSGLAPSVTTLVEDGIGRRATLRLDAAGDWTLAVLDASDRAVDFVVPVR